MFWLTARKLKSKDDEARLRAARKLGELKDTRAIEPLAAALNDRYLEVRKAAAQALTDIGDEKAVTPLTIMLNYPDDDEVRKLAAITLGELGYASAVAPLLAALKDKKWGVRGGAAEALGRIGDPLAVEPLISLLKDGDGGVSATAARALSAIGDARAIEPLAARLKKKDAPNYKLDAFADALSKFPDKSNELELLLKEYAARKLEEDAKRAEQKRLARIEEAKNAGSRRCKRCEAALQWWSRNTLAKSGMNVVSLSASSVSGERPFDFGGICENCRDGYCGPHAPGARCPKCGNPAY